MKKTFSIRFKVKVPQILFSYALSYAFSGVFVSPTSFSEGEVLGASTQSLNDVNVLSQNTVSSVPIFDKKISLNTQTSFEIKEEKKEEQIPFEIEYKEDPEMEIGEERIDIGGVNGVKKTYYAVTYWLGEETAREKSREEIEEPITQVVYKGTKVVWRELDTEVGELKYWRRIRVWATKYDGNCYGCRGLTYSGTPVRKGVCAVDPKVIPLGTNFYVEGYGLCRSEDIGGGIKGNEVDLGFEEASKAAWGAAWTN